MDERKFQAASLNPCKSVISDILPFSTFLGLMKSAIQNKEVNIFLESIPKNFLCPKIEIG